MSFSAGVFSINSTGQPVVTGTSISASVFNAFTADIATGLSTCLLKDGTQTATALIPFAAGISLSGGSNLTAYSSSSYTGTYTGGTTSPTATIKYVLVGSLVVLDIAPITFTSNATTFTITGAPAAIRPASTKVFLVRVSDNGGAVLVAAGQMNSSGVLSLFATPAGGAFTASGTKAVSDCEVSYTLG